MKEKIPSKFKHLFWEYNLEDLDLEKHSYEIIERIIMRGGIDSVKWLISQYGIERISNNLIKNYNYSPITVRMWSFILNLDYTQAKCMSKPSLLHIFG